MEIINSIHLLSVSLLLGKWQTNFLMLVLICIHIIQRGLCFRIPRLIGAHDNVTNNKTYLVFGRPTFVTSDGRRSLARRWLRVDQLRLVAVVYGEHVWMAVMVSRPPRVRGTVCGQPLVQVVQVFVAGYAAPHASGQQIWRASSAARRLLKNTDVRPPRRRSSLAVGMHIKDQQGLFFFGISRPES